MWLVQFGEPQSIGPRLFWSANDIRRLCVSVSNLVSQIASDQYLSVHLAKAITRPPTISVDVIC